MHGNGNLTATFKYLSERALTLSSMATLDGGFAMEPMDEGAASGLGAKIVGKINELIYALTNDRKADVAWKAEAERRFIELEREVAALKAQNHGLKSSKGKAIVAQRRAESKLEEARRLLH
jgi:hypothetical protein